MAGVDPQRIAHIHALAGGDDPPNTNDTPPARFHSGQELFDMAPETVPWVWHGYMATGVVTLFAGRHKGGKSTLLFCLLRAMVDGYAKFLDHDIDPGGPIVLLTEEGPETLRSKLEPITPEGRERMRIMCRNDVTPRGEFGWAQAVREAGLEALAHRARVVIIDTFAFWAQVRDENDNSIMQEAVAALGELTARGLAVLIVHHHRKSGGDDGDAIRGGSGLQGAVDLIVEMVRPPETSEDDESTERELRAIGRFQETPEAMRVRLEGDGWYRTIGEGTRAQMRALSAEGRIRTYLRDRYPETATRREIQDDTSIAQTTVERVLRDLGAVGDIQSFTDGPRNTKRYRWESDSGSEPYPRGPKNGG